MLFSGSKFQVSIRAKFLKRDFFPTLLPKRALNQPLTDWRHGILNRESVWSSARIRLLLSSARFLICALSPAIQPLSSF